MRGSLQSFFYDKQLKMVYIIVICGMRLKKKTKLNQMKSSEMNGEQTTASKRTWKN